jgi:hypothetical protein
MHQPQAERRRSFRISPKGTVVVSAGEHVEHGRIANISSSGLLAITAENPPEELLDAEVDVELRLDAPSSGWLRLAGRVKRIGTLELAIALEPSEPFVRLIRDSSDASNEHMRVRTVVLIDATSERRAPLADAFHAAGCAVLEVSTPLEAIVRLGETQFEPDLIAIADLPSTPSDDLRRFIEREHPCAKLVTICEGSLELSGSAHCLSSASSKDELVARIRDLLGH